MSLKKSDKIIAVIGVVILIVAAVGIILYTQEADEIEEYFEPVVEYYDFPVSVETENGQITGEIVIEGSRLLRDNSEIITYDVSYSAAPTLRNIEVFVEFKDKNTGLFGLGLLKIFGRDKLTVVLLDEEGNEIDSDEIKGDGNLSLSTTVNDELHFEPFRAKSIYYAEEMLQENLTKEQKEPISYQIKATLQEKELRLRPFARLLEKFGRDTFDYTITCYYYSYSIQDIDYKPSGNEDNGSNEMVEQSLSVQDQATYNHFLITGLASFR